MNIKEIALKVAREMRNASDYTVLDLNCNAVAFAEALIAEIQEQNKPVAWLSRESEGGRICLDVEDSGESGNWSPSFPVFIFPPSPEPQWQPIESAPKDGTEIILYSESYGIDVAQFHKGKWRTTAGQCDIEYPTHWLPLPEALKGEEK